MVALVLVLASTEPTVASAADSIDTIDTERDQPRVKAGISLLAGTFTGATSGILFVPTLGLSGEVGSRFDDRVSVVGRASAVANLLNLNLGLEGLLDYAFSERLAVGGGAGLHFFFGLGVTQSLIVMMPLRLTFAPFGRAANEIARTGLLLGLEVAGGMVVLSVPGGGRDSRPVPVPRAWASGQLSIGYAWW